jgi:hypothetical protein
MSAADIQAAIRESKALLGEPNVNGNRDVRAHPRIAATNSRQG